MDTHLKSNIYLNLEKIKALIRNNSSYKNTPENTKNSVNKTVSEMASSKYSVSYLYL